MGVSCSSSSSFGPAGRTHANKRQQQITQQEIFPLVALAQQAVAAGDPTESKDAAFISSSAPAAPAAISTRHGPPPAVEVDEYGFIMENGDRKKKKGNKKNKSSSPSSSFPSISSLIRGLSPSARLALYQRIFNIQEELNNTHTQDNPSNTTRHADSNTVPASPLPSLPPLVAHQISLDVPRTLSHHGGLQSESGKEMLVEILTGVIRAGMAEYERGDIRCISAPPAPPDYVQGMNYVGAAFLLVFPQPQQATEAMGKLFYNTRAYFNAYYEPGLALLRCEFHLLMSGVDLFLPSLGERLRLLGVEPFMWATSYYLTMATYNIAFKYAIRVWDMGLVKLLDRDNVELTGASKAASKEIKEKKGRAGEEKKEHVDESKQAGDAGSAVSAPLSVLALLDGSPCRPLGAWLFAFMMALLVELAPLIMGDKGHERRYRRNKKRMEKNIRRSKSIAPAPPPPSSMSPPSMGMNIDNNNSPNDPPIVLPLPAAALDDPSAELARVLHVLQHPPLNDGSVERILTRAWREDERGEWRRKAVNALIGRNLDGPGKK